MSASTPPPGRDLRGLWADAFRIEQPGVNVLTGLAGGIASCLPLALGIGLGQPAIGVTACFGGLNSALGVPAGPLRERLSWGLLASLGCCASIAIATVTQPSIAWSVVAAFAVVALATALRAFGRNGGITGFTFGAIFTITNGIPAGTLSVGERTLWFAAGSALGLVLMVVARDPRLAPESTSVSPAAETRAPPLFPAFLAAVGQLRDTFLHDTALRAHAMRLATVVAATTLVYRELSVAHGYWIPLTALAVLQPEEHASHVRAIQRGSGTLVGTVAVALLTVLTGSQWALVAGQGVAAFALFALFARSYFWLVVGLTPTALLTVSAVDYQGIGIALVRAGNSAIGIAVGVAAGELAWRIAPAVARPWRE